MQTTLNRKAMLLMIATVTTNLIILSFYMFSDMVLSSGLMTELKPIVSSVVAFLSYILPQSSTVSIGMAGISTLGLVLFVVRSKRGFWKEHNLSNQIVILIILMAFSF